MQLRARLWTRRQRRTIHRGRRAIPPAVLERGDLEEYRLLRLLGRGGMGEVYLAQDVLLDRLVAVKLIAAAQPTAQARERFFIEARALARLQHPNVVTVYRVGEAEGRPYLVSEFLRGESLQTLPKPVPWRRALDLGIGLARGLAAAHRRGVLHRDIKPANAWVTEEGAAKLLDFGLAKLLEEPDPAPQAPDALAAQEPALTGAGALLGSPLYMPPEAWRSEPASRRGDVYSLGAVLYELCTGRAPLGDVPLEELPRAAQLREPASLTASVPGIDPALALAVERCLSRDPWQRYESGDALREVLEALALGSPRQALLEGSPYRGLLPFEAEHRGLFFGRDADVRAVLERLRSERCVLVTADSGVGKSSLCRAGVLPALAAGALGRPRPAVTFVPGRSPLQALAAALAPLLEQEEGTVLSQLGQEPASVGRALRQRHREGLVLFVDQLEELITVASPQEAAAAALALEAIAVDARGVQLLGAVRSDCFARVAALPGLDQTAPLALCLLRSLSSAGLREAIVAPAKARGVDFESEAMVEALVQAGAEGGLPLLQFALSQLWEALPQGTEVLTASALAQLGGVAGGLARHGDALLHSLTPERREGARQVLLQLVTPEGSRAQRTDAELVSGDEARRRALEALVGARLVSARGGEGGAQARYELAHEALLRHWGTLREWLDGSAEARVLLARVERAALDWERLGRSPDALLGERALQEARRLRPEALRAPERAFVAASERAARGRKRRRWGAAVALPSLLALAAFPFAKLRYDRAHGLALYRQELAALEATAAREVAEASRAREEALARFDAEDPAHGEVAWRAALQSVRDAQAALHQASGVVDRALALGGPTGALEEGRARLLLAQVTLADRFWQTTEAERYARLLTALDTSGAQRARLFEPAPLSLRSSPSGARVRLEPFDAVGLRSAPSRRAVEGHTPWSGALPPGGWWLTVEREGLLPARVPLLLSPGERYSTEVALLPPERLPPGFVYVPAGRFLYGSGDDEGLRRFFFNAQPLHLRTTGAFLMGRHEVTFGDWMAFLLEQSAQRRAQLAPYSPERLNGLALSALPGARWQLTLTPSSQRYVARDGERIRFPGRPGRAALDWRRFPVTAISFVEARQYAGWLASTGRVPGARLCTDAEWERAARGADARRFPGGDEASPGDFNHDLTFDRSPTGFGPDEVGSYPASRSPFGADDLAGNAWEMTESSAGPVLRGGSWYQGALSAQIPNREDSEANNRDPLVGFRICATPQGLAPPLTNP